MSGWKNTDALANNEPKYIASIGREAGYTSDYSNNTILVTSSRLSSNANTAFGMKNNQTAHQGWVNYTVGTGGRAGRIQSEVLVALSEPSSVDANSAKPYFTGI
jgi:hypothetical protein